jgi:hypothetical protein
MNACHRNAGLYSRHGNPRDVFTGFLIVGMKKRIRAGPANNNVFVTNSPTIRDLRQGIPLLSEEGWPEGPGWFQSSSLAS